MRKSIFPTKSGVASFYIVAFSTLILVITVASFATVVISQITRTSNDDLSQSAYDSALAGVEDAKIAYSSYQACIKSGNYQEGAVEAIGTAGGLTKYNAENCNEIIWLMRNPNCDMVARILGKMPVKTDENGIELPYDVNGNNEIAVNESSKDNNMEQAYTCVKINTKMSDYRASLSSSNAAKVIKVNLDKAAAGDIESIKLNWYSNREGEVYEYTNVINSGSKVAFQSLKNTKASVPPTISLQLVQTNGGFTVDQLFEPTNASGQTDRATLYLVPTNNSSAAQNNYGTTNLGFEGNASATYTGAYDGSNNYILKEQVASTNNLNKNLPFLVYCPEPTSSAYTGSEFACSTTIQLPEAIGGGRNSSTFTLMVSLPYEQPNTDFAIEFICKTGATCVTQNAGGGTGNNIAEIRDMQVEIDSTGRANDLYRRMEVRMESTDSTFHYPIYAIEAGGTPGNSGSGGTAGIEKSLTVTSEYSQSEYAAF